MQLSILFYRLPQAVGAMGGLLHSFSSGLGKQLLSPQKRPSSRGQGPPAVAEEEAHLCAATLALPLRLSPRACQFHQSNSARGLKRVHWLGRPA